MLADLVFAYFITGDLNLHIRSMDHFISNVVGIGTVMQQICNNELLMAVNLQCITLKCLF